MRVRVPRFLLVVVVAAATVLSPGVLSPPPALADVQPAAGQYVPLPPVRVVDGTRSAPAGGTLNYSPLGQGGVPATGVSAVAFQLHTRSTGSGYLEVTPTGVTRPTASHLNYVANTWATNAVVTGLGTNGQMAIYNSGTTAAPLSIDILGYYRAPGGTAGSTYVPIDPRRMTTTAQAIAAGQSHLFSPLGQVGIPAANVTAVAAHITASASATGQLTVHPDGVAKPSSVDLNYSAGSPYTNHVPITLGANGKFKVFSSVASTVTIDVVGYFQGPAGVAAGGSYVPLTPARVNTNLEIPANSTGTAQLAGVGGVPATGVAAAAFTLTAKSGGTGAMSVFSSNLTTAPVARTLTYRNPGSWPTLQVSKLGADGKVAIRNTSATVAQVHVDVAGYYRAATAPAAPTGVTATPDNGGATVGWTAPADGGAAITGYTVTAAPGGATVTAAPGSTSARVGGLSNGTAYTFTVKAVNAVGASAASPPSAAVTPTPPATPGRPFITEMVARDRAVTVHWSPPPAGASTVAEYVITATPGPVTMTAPGDATSATLRGLTNGTVYRLTVAARNTAGTGTASELSRTVEPAPAEKAMAPVVTAVIALNQRVDLQWVAPADGGGDITGYTVTANPGGKVLSIPAGTTVASVTGLTNGAATTFTVAAVNPAGTGAARTVTATPVAARAPGVPTDLQVSVPAGGQLAAAWTPPIDTGTGPVTGYTVTASPGGAAVSVAANVTTATLTGLTSSTAYTLTVRAKNAAGTGAPSAASAAIKPLVTTVRTPVLLSAASVATLRKAGSDGRLEFASPPAQVTGLAKDALVVMTPNAKAAGGFYGRVTSTGTYDGLYVVHTVPAALNEAVSAGAVAISGTVTNADVAQFSAMTPGTRLREPTIAGRTVEQGAPSLAAGDPTTGRGVGIRDGSLVVEFEAELHKDDRGRNHILEAQAEITPSFDGHFTIGVSETSGNVSVKADTEFQGMLKLGYGLEFEKEWPLGKVRAACFTVRAGPLPIVVCPEFIVSVKATIGANGGVYLTASTSRTFTAKMEFSGGVVDTEASSTSPGPDPAPVVNPFGSVSAELDLPVTAVLNLYGVAGPAFRFRPFLKFFADTSQDPWWELRGGFRVNAALLSKKFFGKQIDYESGDLVDTFYTIAKAPGAFKGLQITPPDPRATVGTPLFLEVQVFGYPADIPTRWSMVSGPGTVNDTGVFTATGTGVAVVRAESLATGDRPLLTTRTSILIGAAPPGPPAAVTATPGYFSARVSWKPPIADNGSPITGYTVVTSPATTTVRVGAGTTSATIEGLALGETYRVLVYATNAAGVSTPAGRDVRPDQDSFLPVTGSPTNITSADPLVGGSSGETDPELSRDGRYVTFTVYPGSPLAPAALNGAAPGDYLARMDVTTGEVVLVSRAADGATPARVTGQMTAMDGSGNVIAFRASAGAARQDVFVANLSAGTVRNVTAGQTAGDLFFAIELSADGSTIALKSRTSAAGSPEIYYRGPVNGGGLTMIGQSRAGPDPISISGDGRYVLFQEYAAGTPGENVLYDASSGSRTLLHPGKRDEVGSSVDVTALSADASTTAGFAVIPVGASTSSGPFVARTLTAPIRALDLIYTHRGAPYPVTQLSHDGRAALITDHDAATGLFVQAHTNGRLVRMEGVADYGTISGDGRVVAYVRNDVNGIRLQRLG